MVFWGIFAGSKTDNERFAESERKYDDARRKAYLAQKEQEAKEHPASQYANSSDGKKKSKKQKFREGFQRTEAGLNRLADASEKAYARTNKALVVGDRGIDRFADASKAFSISPDESLYGFKKMDAPLDAFITDDRRQYGKKSGAIHRGLDLFDVSAGNRGKDGLLQTYGVSTSRSPNKGRKSDPFIDMLSVSGPRKKSVGKRAKKQDYVWF